MAWLQDPVQKFCKTQCTASLSKAYGVTIFGGSLLGRHQGITFGMGFHCAQVPKYVIPRMLTQEWRAGRDSICFLLFLSVPEFLCASGANL